MKMDLFVVIVIPTKRMGTSRGEELGREVAVLRVKQQLDHLRIYPLRGL